MHRRPDLYTRWSLETRRQEFFHAGQRVGVAVSGGPDSVLLLHFLKDLAEELGLMLAAVHFNHHLRGADADADEAFVRELAAGLRINFLRNEADVRTLARASRRNLEATARDLRYRYFFSLVEQGRLDRVATGHTANDQAETVLMRLLRGAGTRGLGAIHPVVEGSVVRPFLGVRREEVMQEIAARGWRYRVDASNLDVRLRRNKIRLELLPLLEREYNPQIVAILSQLAECCREDESTLQDLARERAHPWPQVEVSEARLPACLIGDLPPALGRRVLRLALHAARGIPVNSYQHTEALRRFAAQAPSGRMLSLPGGAFARKEFSWLVVGCSNQAGLDGDFSYTLSVPGELAVRELGCMVRVKILNRADLAKAYNNSKMVGLDARKLAEQLVLRNWRPGDSFCPVGSRRVRKLKELFCERKVPAARRRHWPVMLCGAEIVWVRGFPPAKDAAATRCTEQVVVVEEEALPSQPAVMDKSL